MVYKPSADGREAYTIMSPISKYYMTIDWADLEESYIFLGTKRLLGESDWQLLPTGVPNEYRIRNSRSYYYAVVKGAST